MNTKEKLKAYLKEFAYLSCSIANNDDLMSKHKLLITLIEDKICRENDATVAVMVFKLIDLDDNSVHHFKIFGNYNSWGDWDYEDAFAMVEPISIVTIKYMESSDYEYFN